MRINFFCRFSLLIFLGVTLFLFAPTNKSSAAHSESVTLNQTVRPTEGSTPSFLTAPQEGEPLDIATAYLNNHYQTLGLLKNDLAYQIQDYVPTEVRGELVVTHIWLNQTFNNIPVYNGVMGIHVAKDGSIVAINSDFVPDLTTKAKAASSIPSLTAVEAVISAAEQLDLSLNDELTLLPNLKENSLLVSKGDIANQDIPLHLSYHLMADGSIKLAWNITIDDAHSPDYWNVQIDATDGSLLHKVNYTIYDNFHAPAELSVEPNEWVSVALAPKDTTRSALFAVEPGPGGPVPGSYSYNVYPLPYESPIHAPITPPADGRTAMTAVGDARYSPYGWHDTDGNLGAEFTHTRGNNVHAYTDRTNNNNPDNPVGGTGHPDAGPSLVFNPPLNLNNAPNTYQDAAVVNLFYWNNIMHDVFYGYGFDEPNGNFQANNYNNGGAGGDYVLAEAQDGSGTNNANMSTPADGGNGRMQMYIWDAPNPDIDGDFDNGIIAHEYGHGISIRQTGGPGNSGCLGNQEQMGEGWGDWYALMLTIVPSDIPDGGDRGRGIGTYALDQPTTGAGIRAFPYSTNMTTDPRTYDEIKTAAIPHGVGSTWAAMLWELNWGLINEHGWSDNIYMPVNPANIRGNHIAMHLVNIGLQLQPCSPGFVDGRDAILQADQLLYNGANQCIIWEAFAKRGLGENAIQGSSANRGDGTEDFTVPTACAYIFPTPTSIDICAGDSADFYIRAGTSLTPPVTLSVANAPAGTNQTFSVNPINSVPDKSTLTIDNTAAVPFGSYPMQVDGNGNPNVGDINLNVYDAIPGIFTNATPANGVSDQNVAPTLSWNSSFQAINYTVEIASDSAFSSIIHSETGLTALSYTVPNGVLAFDTVYYWRIQAHNSCGDSSYSETFAFRTMETVCVAESPGTTGALVDATCGFFCQLGFEPPTPGVANFTLNVGTAGPLVDLDVINLNGTHSWVGDIYFELLKGAQTVEVMPNMCGDYNDFAIGIDDSAPGVSCPATGPDTGPVTGIFNGGGGANALANFNGVESSGTWTLRITDIGPTDTGNLTSWGLNVCHQAPTPTGRDYSDLSAPYSIAWHDDDAVNLQLGALWDTEVIFDLGVDDPSDDGIVLGATVVGNAVSLDATVSGGPGYLACWFDWDQDGFFANDLIEKAVAQNVVAGVNNISVPVPLSYDGSTDLSGLETRCRLYNSEPTLWMGTETPDGTATGGEVEDYIFAPPTAGCAAPADVLDLSVAPNGTFVDLSWSTNGADRYEVHRGTMPYFAVIGDGPTVVSEPTVSPHTDNSSPNTYGDPASNYFYYLLPENGCGAWANQSNHVGEFDFAIVPGA